MARRKAGHHQPGHTTKLPALWVAVLLYTLERWWREEFELESLERSLLEAGRILTVHEMKR